MCGGRADCAPARLSATEGRSGSALFRLRAQRPGAVVTLDRPAWDACVRAARAVCPTGSLAATCLGGASAGDVRFSLGGPASHDAEL